MAQGQGIPVFNSTQWQTSYCSINAMFPEHDFQNVLLREHDISKNKAAEFKNKCRHFGQNKAYV